MIEALMRTAQLNSELLKVRMRVAMLERMNDSSQDFNRIVMEQVMTLRDLLPHASTLIDMVKAWKTWGALPGGRVGALVAWSVGFSLAGVMLVRWIF